MAYREMFDKNTKNYKALKLKFQESIKDSVSTLMQERNQLKAELMKKTEQLRDLEMKVMRSETMIEVLQSQLQSEKELFTQADFFAKSVLNIATNLAHDESDVEQITMTGEMLQRTGMNTQTNEVPPAPAAEDMEVANILEVRDGNALDEEEIPLVLVEDPLIIDG